MKAKRKSTTEMTDEEKQRRREYDDFMWKATEQDKNDYKNCHGHTAKNAFRDAWHAKKMGDMSGAFTSKKTDRKEEKKEGWYVNFLMLVKARGGQIDLKTAWKEAEKIAKKMRKKGAPYVMYDPWGEVIMFMDLKIGMSETYSNEKGEVVEGEMNIDQEALREAMDESKKKNFQAEIPTKKWRELEDKFNEQTESNRSEGRTSNWQPSNWTRSWTPSSWDSGSWSGHWESEENDWNDQRKDWDECRDWKDRRDGEQQEDDTPMEETAAPGTPQEPETEEQKKERIKAEKKAKAAQKRLSKSQEEVAFAVVQQFGKRMKNVIDFAQEVKKHAEEDPYYGWAKSDLETVTPLLTQYTDLNKEVQKRIVMSNFKKFISQQMYETKTASDWIMHKKDEVMNATTDLENHILPMMQQQKSRERTFKTSVQREAEAQAKRQKKNGEAVEQGAEKIEQPRGMKSER